MWAVDVFGLVVSTSLVAAAAGASVFPDAVAGLMLAVPLAGFAILAAEPDQAQQTEQPKTTAMRTIVITPRPGDARGAP